MFCIFVSEVASAIGESNNFSSVEQTTHKIIERNFKEQYSRALSNLSKKKTLNKLIENLDEDARRLVMINIDEVKKASDKVEFIVQLLEKNQHKIPNHQVSLRKKEEIRDEVYSQNKNNEIDNLISQTQLSSSELERSVAHLPEIERKLFIEKAYMERGKILENQVLDNMEKEKKMVIVERNAKGYKKTLQFNDNLSIVLYGKIDGYSEETKTLIEIKTRKNGLTTKMWKNEEIQMFCYMYLLGIENGILREQFNDKIKEYDVKFNEEEWQNIEKKLKHFSIKVMEYVENLDKLEKLIENVRSF